MYAENEYVKKKLQKMMVTTITAAEKNILLSTGQSKIMTVTGACQNYRSRASTTMYRLREHVKNKYLMQGFTASRNLLF